MMCFSRQNDTKKISRNELQLSLLPNVQTKFRQRKINRWPIKENESAVAVSDESSEPRNGEESDNGPEQQEEAVLSMDEDDNGPSFLQPKSYKHGKLEDLAPRFGPCYGSDLKAMSETKKKTLEHVLKFTSDKCSSEQAMETYVSAVRKVEEKARQVYAETVECSGPEFLMMMIHDGCFFLQLALWILGDDPKCLQYPTNNPLFGEKPTKNSTKLWMEAMFFVGNQIPFVILHELMNQKFFQIAIQKGKWDPPPASSFLKKILYDLLILPKNRGRRGAGLTHLPSDVLHGLYDLVIGPDPQAGEKKNTSEDMGDFDLEANEDTGNGKRINQLSIDDNKKRFFPCATQINSSGICIAKLKKGGVRGISFKSNFFGATLYLPAFPVDGDTGIVFENLKKYEISQQSEKHKRVISSYLRLMSDLVQTSKDLQLLQRNGIIQECTRDEEELSELLSWLGSEVTTLSDDFHVLKRKIGEYSGPPWARVRSILNVVALLTLVQTVFSVLAYVKPLK